MSLMKARKLIRNQKGQSLTEFTFVFVGLIALIIALSGLATLGYNWLVLQYAAAEASRYGSLGQVDPEFSTREESIQNRINEIVTNLGVDEVNVAFTDESGGATAGSSSEFFQITISKQLNLLPAINAIFDFANSGAGQTTYQISARTVIRNEPF